MVLTKEKIKKVVDATENVKISREEEINAFLDNLNVARHFLMNINKGVDNLITALEELTWIKSSTDEDVLIIKMILSSASNLIPVLVWNYNLFVLKFGNKLPEVIEENKRIVEDLEEVISDVRYSFFEHTNTDKMNALYEELKNM